jgi:hypothetical protein
MELSEFEKPSFCFSVDYKTWMYLSNCHLRNLQCDGPKERDLANIGLVFECSISLNSELA